MSSTAAMAERRIGDNSDLVVTPTSDFAKIGVYDAVKFNNGDPVEISRFAADCASPNVPPSGWIHGDYNQDWLWGEDYTYTHLVTPNGRSCINAATTPTFDSYAGIAPTASSYHAGGVHVLMCDGAVRFVSDNINRGVWWGLATRSGNEVLGEY